uniref:Putative secreted protein n=1 Tax=Ixodes ricinus TaxID=34613 RepID=A0A6B0TVU3_IXORI
MGACPVINFTYLYVLCIFSQILQVWVWALSVEWADARYSTVVFFSKFYLQICTLILGIDLTGRRITVCLSRLAAS